MKDWTALDVLICVAPFIVIAGFAAHAIRRGQRVCVCCRRLHPTVTARRRHELIWRAM